MNAEDPILARVMELLADKGVAGRELTPQSRIVADTTLDSVSVMDLVLEIEDEFDITMPLNQIAEIRTIEELSCAVASLRKHGREPDEG